MIEKIMKKLKDKHFWYSLIIIFGFILPLSITIIGAIGYGLFRIEFMESRLMWGRFILFGIIYGIPAMIIISIIFYFIEKKKAKLLVKNPEQKTGDLDNINNKDKKRMHWTIKFIIGFIIIFVIYPLFKNLYYYITVGVII